MNFNYILKIIIYFIVIGFLISSINLWFYFQPSAVELWVYRLLQFDRMAWLSPGVQLLSDSVITLVILSIGLAAWLWFKKFYISAAVVTLTLALLPLTNMLKDVFQRPRPVLEGISTEGFLGTSFPSVHSLTALLVSGVIVLIYCKLAPGRQRPIWLIVAISYALLIGWSRIFLGAHYPSDVLGGYVLACALLVIIAAVYAWATSRWQRL